MYCIRVMQCITYLLAFAAQSYAAFMQLLCSFYAAQEVCQLLQVTWPWCNEVSEHFEISTVTDKFLSIIWIQCVMECTYQITGWLNEIWMPIGHNDYRITKFHWNIFEILDKTMLHQLDSLNNVGLLLYSYSAVLVSLHFVLIQYCVCFDINSD